MRSPVVATVAVIATSVLVPFVYAQSNGDACTGASTSANSLGQVLRCQDGTYRSGWTISGTTTYFTNGNVGVNTSAPNSKLHVNGATQIGNYADLSNTMLSVTDGATVGRAINIMSNNGNGAALIGSTGETDATNGLLLNAYRGGGTIQFRITGSEKMRIANDGNVGIGTTNPQTELDVNGTIQGTNIQLTSGSSTINVGRGSVYIENNENDNADGAGLTFRTANNPTTGGILAVRSSGQANRFWVGQAVTSSGENPFYVGTDNDGYSNPGIQLNTNGTATFNGAVTVATPTAGGHAATKAYVDAAMASPEASGNAGAIQFSDGTNISSNINRFFWDNTAYRLGINTSSPQLALDVANAEAAAKFGPGNGTESAIKLWGYNSSSDYSYIQAGGGDDNGKLRFAKYNTTANNLDQFQVYSDTSYFSGSVGVGAVSPGNTGSEALGLTALQVNGVIMVNNDTNADYGVITEAMAGGIGLAANVYSYMDPDLYVAVGGNVGINIISPTAKFHVYNAAGGPSSGYRLSNAHDIVSWYFDGTDDDSPFVINYNNSGGYDMQIQADGDVILGAGGNVGIGTSTPESKLDVNGSAQFTDGAIVKTSAAANSSIGWFDFRDSNDDVNGNIVYSHADDKMSFGVYDASAGARQTAITIDGENRSVGIYRSIPTANFDVVGDIRASSVIESGNGTGSVALTTNDGGGNASVTFNHRSRIPDVAGNVGRIRVNVDATSGSIMEFQVADNAQAGSSVALNTTVMTIAGTNRVGIGTTNPNFTLDVLGSIGNNATTYHTSDRRLKKDITPLQKSLNKILDLQGVTFKWKKPLDKPMEAVQIGVIAQDVQKVVPEAVITAEDASKTLSVNYEAFSPLLIEATKEQQTQIEALKAENSALKARLDAIEAKMGL